ncbi:hypothetical protein [Pseudoduganella namucuonensis]|uniref:Uncharacterized protein n=1 Tax=Pseudoduganella namucuonensis TaxID=1035707 RepID=A0A1I7EZ81_9BURK|nr:hypothetical protein [Pseudoduganella namucuonensis]SFU29233.1 hypothetical protein SAMN05216552_1001261 [Pseudoduganella namucuonensis]
MANARNTNDHEPIDLANLSLVALLQRAKLGQLFAVLASVLAMIAAGFTAGYHLNGISGGSALAAQKAELLEDCGKRTKELEKANATLIGMRPGTPPATRDLCKQEIIDAQRPGADKVADLSSKAREANEKLNACLVDLRTERNMPSKAAAPFIPAQESATQSALTACTNEVNALKVRQPAPLNTYYINAHLRRTSFGECTAAALDAATKLNVVGRRNEDEVHLTTPDGYYCSMYCGEIKVISCNGPVYSTARVFSDRLTKYLDAK